MLSDALQAMRERFSTGDPEVDCHGIVLALHAYEIEARNMENRIELLSGCPHVALDGRLMSGPMIEIGGQA